MPTELKHPEPQAGYITFDPSDPESVKLAASAALKAAEVTIPLSVANGSSSRRFNNIEPGISVRDGFTRHDYEFFREQEMIPKFQKDAIALCMAASRKGIIANVVETMSDFGARGIRLVHEDTFTEKVYQNWFKLVGGPERSERFLSMLYKGGNTIVKRNTGKLNSGIIKKLRKGIAKAKPDLQIPLESPNTELPYRYYIPNPLRCEVINPELSLITGRIRYGFKLNSKIRSLINNPKTDPDLLKEIPSYIIDAVKNAPKSGPSSLIPYDPEKTVSFHYKKDDDELWAFPMIYRILDDLIVLEKLKLADLVALDGAISKIRIWKLGSLDTTPPIFPNDAIVEKLQNIILSSAGNGGVIDIIWNPAIDLLETSTDIAQFLGAAKYQPTYEAIYAGIGIPQTIRGAAGSNMTDNFVQIKTFVEKLQYGRDRLTEFWEGEIKIARRALASIPGFSTKRPAKVVYDHMSLTDEAAQTKIIMDLLDRDVISIQTAREDLGYDNELESARVAGETTNRKTQPKVSPYHDAQPEHSYNKVFAQTGAVTPSELGVKLEEKTPGQMSGMDLQLKQSRMQQQSKTDNKTGVSGQGRPKNKADTKPRKKRIPLVANVAAISWANNAQTIINKTLLPIYLKQYSKSNVRQFTVFEQKSFEDIKFAVLSSLPPMVPVTAESIMDVVSKPFNRFKDVNRVYSSYINDLKTYNPNPSLDDIRQLQALACINETFNEDI